MCRTFGPGVPDEFQEPHLPGFFAGGDGSEHTCKGRQPPRVWNIAADVCVRVGISGSRSKPSGTTLSSGSPIASPVEAVVLKNRRAGAGFPRAARKAVQRHGAQLEGVAP